VIGRPSQPDLGNTSVGKRPIYWLRDRFKPHPSWMRLFLFGRQALTFDEMKGLPL